jgi:predicted nucleic acid-binding protein
VSALDAGLLIAHFSPRDAHHAAATEHLAATADTHWIGPLALAEVLVPHVEAGSVDDLLGILATLGIREAPLAEDAAVRLAVLRATTGLKMPDCCVLLTAEQTGSAVATFDARLRRAAERVGLAVVPADA